MDWTKRIEAWTGRGSWFDMGERFPVLDGQHRSSMEGLWIVGNLAGTPDIKAALNAGHDVAVQVSRLPRPDPSRADIEVVIIGGGPAGVAAALELQRAGVSYRLLERRRLFTALRAFDPSLPLYRAVTGDPALRGGLWFGDCSTRDLLKAWDRSVAEASLAVEENVEVLALTRPDIFHVRTSTGLIRAHRVILAVGRTPVLKKLGVITQDPLRPWTGGIGTTPGVRRDDLLDATATPPLLDSIGIALEGGWDPSRWKRFVAALVGCCVFYITKKQWPGPFSLEGAALGASLVAFVAIMVAVAVLGTRRLDPIASGRPAASTWLQLGWQYALPMVIVLGILHVVSPGWFTLDRRSLGALYPLAYTIVVVVFGVRAALRYRDPTQTRKYALLMLCQSLLFGILPEFVLRHRWLGYSLGYVWPLGLSPTTWPHFWDPTGAGLPPDPLHLYFWWALVSSFVILPVAVVLTGKSYCSWVCGCGGLAETVGDVWRHNSPKGPDSIRREVQIFWVLAFAAVLTALAALGTFGAVVVGGAAGTVLVRVGRWAGAIYGWSVDLFLCSIIPIAAYPFLGGKIWCRYWCPTAGFMQVMSTWFTKKGQSRYRIDADKERCIACNHCTRYCEVGIDVRKFALKGESVDTQNSSCIGCGICITVCPTEVLRFAPVLIALKPRPLDNQPGGMG